MLATRLTESTFVLRIKLKYYYPTSYQATGKHNDSVDVNFERKGPMGFIASVCPFIQRLLSYAN